MKGLMTRTRTRTRKGKVAVAEALGKEAEAGKAVIEEGVRGWECRGFP